MKVPVVALSSFAVLGFVVSLWAADATVEFNRDVRPILSDKCFTCHGPDAAAKKVPIRLDREDAARPVLEGGQASRLLDRISTSQKARRMPPVYSGLSLSEREIETLRTWVMQGAK